MPRCLIIAGPNGAGKTTFALEYLPILGITHFINADMIAAGLSPFKPETQAVTASRLFLREMEQKIQAQDDFAFETTLSGRSYLKLIKRLRQSGWTVDLYYLALPSVDMSLWRVAERVRHGGHNIPENVIRRRFPRSLHNLFKNYVDAVDRCTCFINAGGEVIQVFESDVSGVRIGHEAAYHDLKEMARL